MYNFKQFANVFIHLFLLCVYLCVCNQDLLSQLIFRDIKHANLRNLK